LVNIGAYLIEATLQKRHALFRRFTWGNPYRAKANGGGTASLSD
jgi:hypothetical protein